MKKLLLLLVALYCIGVTSLKAQFVDLLDFSTATTSGAQAYGSLIISGTTMYGMTTYGGANNLGTIFSVQTNGTGYTDLFDFDGTANGQYPMGSLILSGTTLYGMTVGGGPNVYGVVFSIQTNGTGYTHVFDFIGTTGSGADGSLVLSGSTLYGMTNTGGANNDGVVFSVQTNGTGYTDLLDFNTTNGGEPFGSLTLSGSTLYGMTSIGGLNDDGLVFSLQTNGTGYTDLLDFNTVSPSATSSYGSLILSGSTLYGMAAGGGTGGDGVVFSLQTNGTGYTDLLDFNGTNGNEPYYSSLVLSGTTLYGMTPLGGANSEGSIFSVQTNGTGYTDMLDFNGTNGKNPYGSLTLSGTTLYGMTSLGGANNLGLIFSSSVLTSLNELPNNIGQGQLFPNPSNGKFTFSLPSSPAKQQLNIYNVLGEKVYQSSIDLKSTQVIIPNPVSGIYFYRLLSSNGTLLSSGKFIIEL